MVVIRHLLKMALALLALFSAPGVEAQEQLRLLTWSSYLSPQVVERFEKENGVKVTVETVTNYVDLIKPLETGTSGFDIAFPADFQVRGLINRGLLEKAMVEKMSNFWNIEDVWRSRSLDPRNEYTVPHVWGTTAFVVDTAQYHGPVDTLNLLFNPPAEIRGKIMLMDSGYDMVQLALIWMKLPRCSTKADHLARVENLLLPMLRQYPLADIDTIIDSLVDPKVALGVAWNGDALKARQKRPTLRYAYPKEGSLVWTDVLVIPKGAPNRALALKFMNFMMRPDVASLESDFNGYANMIRGSERFMDKALLNAPEIVTPISSALDFFTYCDNIAEAQQEIFWKALKEKAGK